MRKNLQLLSGGLALSFGLVLAGCFGPPSPQAGGTVDASDRPPSQETASVDKPLLEPPAKVPVVVHQDADRSIQLSALTARLSGKGLRLDENDRIVGFRDRTQRATWRMKLVAPGTYQVESDTLCTGPTREARMRVRVGETLFVEELSELSENAYLLAKTSLGELKLDTPGTYEVEVEMVGLPLVGDFAIAELRLIPGEVEPSPLPMFKLDEDSDQKP